MKNKAVIFDLDGTLIDSMQVWRQVDTSFLGSRGIEVPPDLFEHLPNGNSFIQTAQYFKDRFNLSDTVDAIMQEWTDMVTKEYEEHISLKNGAQELLQELKSNEVRIGLGTSNSMFLAEKVLTANGVWGYIEKAVTGEQVKLGKPFPEIYLKVAELLELSPQDCVVIEDTLSGVRAGKAAGMRVIALYDPDSAEQEIQIRAEADLYAQDYQEIRRMLCQISYI